MLTLFAGLGWILYLLGLMGGLILVPLGFPGTWVIVLCAFFYSIFTDFQAGRSDFWPLFFVILMAVVAELLEFGIGILASKRTKVSNGAIVASIIGGLFGTMIGLPIFIIGSFLGLLLGTFLGAFVYEIVQVKDFRRALRVATASFFSRITAMFVKTMVALAMVIYVLTTTF